MASKRTHGLLVRKYDEIVDGTIEDFNEVFRFKRDFFKDYPKNAKLVIGEVIYEKEDFIERLIYIEGNEHRLKFHKKKEIKTRTDDEEYEWRLLLAQIYGSGYSK